MDTMNRVGVRHIRGVIVLGQFMKARRKALDNLSQEELGALIGADQKMISRIENSRTEVPPPAEILNALAVALACESADLLRAAGYAIDENGDRPAERALLWAGKTADFTDEEQAIVDAVVDQIRRNKRDQ